ncbi:MAG: hypothetical protein HYZ75_04370 [Elusimicrobia bacterium]|nr:hypothetical protein [Elusimicrobiota bacterium]
MPRTSIAFLALALFAVPARADQALDLGPRLFDGSAGAVASLPKFNFTPSRPPAQAEPKRSKQSGSDLFYFSPEEAAEGMKLFGSKPPAPAAGDFTFDDDVPADIQTQMRSDLAFVGGVSGDGATPLHQEIFGELSGAVYSAFFKSRVTAVGMSNCGSSNAVACVKPFFDPSKMWLTQNYIRFSHPQIARMMVVYHEARHTETSNSNWYHASCPSPFRDAEGNEIRSIWTGSSLAGEPACDSTPRGSYGSSTIMLKNIQLKCTSCTAKVRMDAGLYADDQFGRIIGEDARRQMIEDFKK